jgi:hypothetical protein
VIGKDEETLQKATKAINSSLRWLFVLYLT